MIQKAMFRLGKNDMEVLHIEPDQLPYICIYEPMEHRIDGTIAWHWHQYFEISYVAEGEIECCSPDQVIRLQKGDAVFINSGVLHMYRKVRNTPGLIYAHVFDSIFFTGSVSSGMYQKYIYPILASQGLQLQKITPCNRHQKLMLESITNMTELARREPFGYEFQLQHHLSQFWCRLLTLTADRQSTEPSASGTDVQRIKQMLQFIHQHYPQRITLKDIADAASISERECSRCFQRCFHVSAIGYLNEHRMRMAAQKLLQTQESITQISESCGFRSASYFGKQFHAALGCTPKEYRRRSSAEP